MIKKAFSLIMALVLCFSLCGCACKHEEWEAATCTSPKTCKACGATEGSAIGHSWKSATCTSPKTCKACGATEGSAIGHSWESATCTSAKKCKRCAKTEGSPKGHTYSDGKCTQCWERDPRYTEVQWEDIFTGTPYMNIWMNSVGGIAWAWEHEYTGGKTVNYITIEFTLFDAVGNPAEDEHYHRSTHSVRIVGPWSGNELYYRGLGTNPDILVYCGICHKVRFDTITLEYADGTVAICQYGWLNTVDR